MWELDCEESWAPKNWCFWTVVLEKTLESPLDCKEIQTVHSKGDQSWVFFGRTNAKAETPVLWPPHAKSWLNGKDSEAGRDWGQEEKGTTEDEMAGWHHRLDGHEFGWTPEVRDGQGGLACCNSWGRKESDTTEQLNWTELKYTSCYNKQDQIWEARHNFKCPGPSFPRDGSGSTDSTVFQPTGWEQRVGSWKMVQNSFSRFLRGTGFWEMFFSSGKKRKTTHR